MEPVKWENKNGIACLSMCKGGNTHNLEFATTMNRILDEITMDLTVKSLVLSSTDPKNFCLGIDVDWISKKFQDKSFQDIKEFMAGMNSIFKKLLLFPVPTIAAVNGHAFGNGAIISCACDFRFMRSDKGFFCFPEVDLGIPFLPGMLAFVKKAIPLPLFNDIYLSGRRVGAPELFEHGVIQKACANADELLSESMAFAATFTKKRGIFSELKKRHHKAIVRVLDEEDPPVIESLKLFITD
ncbi:MAG: enoyl-CoA hydratase/isomerase family protein [Proteobacteria bacterium]|nr:enoyl-CoA hydratase/isomerase family protein [Pseudomonadota bacterium]